MKHTLGRFLLVGLVNTFVGLSIIFFLLNAVGLSYWMSIFLGNTAGARVSFLLNRSFTFQSSGSVLKSGFRFAAVILLCYAISYGAGKELIERLFDSNPSLSPAAVDNLQVLIGVFLYTLFNYLLQKWYVFPLEDNKAV